MPDAVDHAEAALERLTREDIARLPPTRLRRFASLCHHWAQLAEHRDQPAKAGVLSKLNQGERSQ